MALPNGVSITTKSIPAGVCPKCEGKGYTVRIQDGIVYSRECECRIKERVQKRIRESGLTGLIDRYTLESYAATEDWQRKAKAKAISYLADGGKSWFFISGTPGSGKTHICTAIVGKLIEANKNVRYMLWREEAPRLKALINDRGIYDAEMRKLKDCEVLYIDDFFKGSVTDGDINLAFELINDRYNTQKATIISGEKDIAAILNIDEAIGSRIYERSKGYCLKNPNYNHRLK